MKRISEIEQGTESYQQRLIAWQIIFSSFDVIVSSWQRENPQCQLLSVILQKTLENPYYFLSPDEITILEELLFSDTSTASGSTILKLLNSNKSAEIYSTYVLSPEQVASHIRLRFAVIPLSIQQALSHYHNVWHNYLNDQLPFFDVNFRFLDLQRQLAKSYLGDELFKDGFSYLKDRQLKIAVDALKENVVNVLDVLRQDVELEQDGQQIKGLNGLCHGVVKHSKEPGITETLVMDYYRDREANMRLLRDGKVIFNDRSESEQSKTADFQLSRKIFSGNTLPLAAVGNVLLDIEDFAGRDQRLKALLSCLFTQELAGIQGVLSAIFFRKDQPLRNLVGHQALTTPAFTSISFDIKKKEIVIRCLATNKQFKMLDDDSQNLQTHPSYVAAFTEIIIDRSTFHLTSLSLEFITMPHEKTKPKQLLCLMPEQVFSESHYTQQITTNGNELAYVLVAYHARNSLSKEPCLSLELIHLKQELITAPPTENILDILRRLKKYKLSQTTLDEFALSCLNDKEIQQFSSQKRSALYRTICDFAPYVASLFYVQFAIYILKQEKYRARLSSDECQTIFQKYQHDVQFVITAEETGVIDPLNKEKRSTFLCKAVGYQEGASGDALGKALAGDESWRARNLLQLLMLESSEQQLSMPYVVPCNTQADLTKLISITANHKNLAQRIIALMLRQDKYHTKKVNIISLIRQELNGDVSTQTEKTVFQTIRDVLQDSVEVTDLLMSTSITSLTLTEITEIARRNKSGQIGENLLSGAYWKFFHKGRLIWYPCQELGSAELKTLLIQHKNNAVVSMILSKPKKKTVWQRLFSCFLHDDDYRKRLSPDDIKELANNIEIKEGKTNEFLAAIIKTQSLAAKDVIDIIAKSSYLAKMLFTWKLAEDVNLVEEMIKSKLLGIINKKLSQDKLTYEQLTLLDELSRSDIFKNVLKDNAQSLRQTVALKMKKFLEEEAIVSVAKHVVRSNTYHAIFIEKLEQLSSVELQQFKEQHQDLILSLFQVGFTKDQTETIHRLLDIESNGMQSQREKTEFSIGLDGDTHDEEDSTMSSDNRAPFYKM